MYVVCLYVYVCLCVCVCVCQKDKLLNQQQEQIENLTQQMLHLNSFKVRVKEMSFVHVCVYGSRTTPHEDNSPPDKNKAQPLPTRTTIPRAIPHQDNSPLGPLPRNKTTHQDQNLYGRELSSGGVVRIRCVCMCVFALVVAI